MKHIQKLFFLLIILFISSSADAQSFRSLMRKADQQYKLHAYNLAIQSYEEALNKRNNDQEALGRIADCYRFLNEMEQAADYYSQALRQRNPEDSHYLNFGKVLMALGRYDEAKRYFLEYAKSDPTEGNNYAKACDFARLQQGMGSDFSVFNERVNSTASDFGPAYYQNQLVFSSARTDIQRSTYSWDGQAKNQMFLTRPGVDGYLQPPTFLKGTPNERGEGPASFSPDGKMIAFTRNNFVSGVRHINGSGMEMSIFIADLGTDGNYFNERPFPYNDDKGRTGYPAFTTDGSAMFFASDRKGGYGGFDLYISYLDNGSWTAPINLGPVVNTEGNEVSPFYDGNDLYFASDWHEGFGGYDIFRATEGNGKWAVVTNMGQPVNSPRDDYGFVYESLQQFGYLTSNRPGGRGAEDIYRISKSGGELMVRVVNASDGTPIPNARIDMGRCLGGSGSTVTTDAQGVYSMAAFSGLDCEIVVSSNGYVDNRVQISTFNAQGGREIEIPLTRYGQEYYGTVISYNTRQPLENVVVRARNLTSGSTIRMETDRNGEYVLALSPNSAYLISYSGQGYREINRNVSTGNGQDRDILGAISMYATDYVPGPEPPVNPNPEPPYNPNPQPPYNPNPQPPVNQSGFAIQLAALRSAPDLNKFANLNSLGRVYAHQEAGAYKVRLGVFSSRYEAEQALAQVRRSGYSQAFLVTESGGGGTVVSPQPQPPTTLPPTAGPETSPNTGAGNYKIQLVALRNTRWFDPSKINHLGYIEDRRKGELTIKLLSSFSTFNSASRALDEVKRNGFSTAYIVMDQGGELIKVNN